MDFLPGLPSRLTIFALAVAVLTVLYFLVLSIRLHEEISRPSDLYLLGVLSGCLILGIVWLTQ